jgi:hypothetical protein
MAPVRGDGGGEVSAPINDGGPAFPCVYYSEPIGSIGPQLTVKGGISMRDYFAGKALQGLMSKVKPEAHWEDYRAKWSYEAADAMLKAREAKP